MDRYQLRPKMAVAAGILLLSMPAVAADLRSPADGQADSQDRNTWAGNGPSGSWSARKNDTAINELNGRLINFSAARLPLEAALEIIAKQAKVTATIEKGMTATITNTTFNGPLRMCMDQIAEQIGAVWWWRGQELRLASRRHSVTRTIKSRNANAVIAAAKELGMPVHVVTIQKASGLGMLRITGPAALVGDIDTLATDVDKQLNTVQAIRYGKSTTR